MESEFLPAERSKVDSIVLPTLMAGEVVRGLFKENRKRLPPIQMIWPSRVGMTCAKLVSDGDQFAKVSWHRVVWIAVAVAILIVFTIMVLRDIHPGFTVIFFLAAMIVSYNIMFKALQGRAYAVTNQRVICFSLPLGAVLGSLNLRDLMEVDIIEEKDDTRDLVLRLSTTSKVYAMRALDDVDAAKSLMTNVNEV